MEESQNKRLKVLLCCYACDPSYGSEPGMGWNFAYHISRFHDAHVLVEEKFKENLLAHSKKHPEDVKNITFHFIKKQRHRTLRKIWPPSYYWFYREWHKKAYRYAVELDKKENFDLIHQITLATYREPGYLWKIKKPFIWGPLGGFVQTTWRLLSHLSTYQKFYFIMRNIINAFQLRFGYAARKVSKKSHTILVSDPQILHRIQNQWNKRAIIMREVGCDTLQEKEISTHVISEPLRVCWVGTLIPTKALHFILHAIPLCNNNIQLEILGKGPMLNTWRKLSEKLGISDKVRFHGHVHHDFVASIMSNCHAFCMTSIKEGGTATVVIEALQNGLPLIVLNHCGYASVVNDSCGIRIPIYSTKQIIQDFARNLDKLAENEALRKKLAKGAIERSRDFTWENKMTILNQVYSEAVTSSKL